ncbi:MAG: CDP-diacylglycerol--glycerol-3-phosphate 3-phosphatidyltransferase [Desulfovibrionaceae bacterium]
MFNLANNLTLFRIAVTPLLVILLSFPNRATCYLATVLFILASITDLVDGMVARRRNEVTSLGKFLDPLADKLLVCSALIMLAAIGRVEGWVAVVIVCREILVTGLRAIAVDNGVVIAADRFGKIKTLLQVLALIPLLAHYPLWGLDLRTPGHILLYLAVFMAVFSGVNYLYKFYKHLLYSSGEQG